jgi:hypothetical protein
MFKNFIFYTSYHLSVVLHVSAAILARTELPGLFSPLTDSLEFQNIFNHRIDIKVRLKSNLDMDEAINNLTMKIQSIAQKPPNLIRHIILKIITQWYLIKFAA